MDIYCPLVGDSEPIGLLEIPTSPSLYIAISKKVAIVNRQILEPTLGIVITDTAEQEGGGSRWGMCPPPLNIFEIIKS